MRASPAAAIQAAVAALSSLLAGRALRVSQLVLAALRHMIINFSECPQKSQASLHGPLALSQRRCQRLQTNRPTLLIDGEFDERRQAREEFRCAIDIRTSLQKGPAAPD